MRFWDRQKEVEALKALFLSEPNAITFLYGPKSSGKSTTILHAINSLPPKSATCFWYDLRAIPISSYADVLRIFFKEKGWLERFGKAIFRSIKVGIGAFEVDAEELGKIASREINPFEAMERELKRGKKRKIIVFDELQRLKWVYMNGERQRPLVAELFNFFVRITKVEHLAHVIVATSDTFFIEEVYKNSALQECAKYMLVDYFDEETTKQILAEEGFSKEEADFTWDWIGGVPWELVEAVEAKKGGKLKGTINELYRATLGRLEDFLDTVEDKLLEKAKDILQQVATSGHIKPSRDHIEAIKRLVEAEILFYDPIARIVRPQTKLMERAIREVVK